MEPNRNENIQCFVWECQDLTESCQFSKVRAFASGAVHLRRLLTVSGQGLDAFDLPWALRRKEVEGPEFTGSAVQISFGGGGLLPFSSFSPLPPPCHQVTVIQEEDLLYTWHWVMFLGGSELR